MNPGLKASLWNQIWCLKEQCFEGSLRHRYRFFFYGFTLKNHFRFQMLLHVCVNKMFLYLTLKYQNMNFSLG